MKNTKMYASYRYPAQIISHAFLHYLWRAVNQDGDELDILVQKRRNKKAAM